MIYQIVFFDKNNKRQGPFTEGQVQEWYRTGWFDRGFKFSFHSKLDQLDDHTPAYSLDELIRHNGHGCPFLGPPIPSIDQKEERLDRLEKKIAEVRSICESILTLTDRVDMIEKRIKDLTVTAPPSLPKATTEESPNPGIEKCSKAIVATPPPSPAEPTKKESPKPEMIEKRAKDLSPSPSLQTPPTKKESPSLAGVPKRIREECEELAGRVAASTMRAIDLLHTGDFGGWDDKRGLKLLTQVEAFVAAHVRDETALLLTSKLIVEELLKRLEGRDHVLCAVCGTSAYNPRQALVHCVSPDHIEAVTKCDSGRMLPPMAVLTKIAQHIYLWGDEEWAKQLSQKGDVSRVVPSREFLFNLQFKHGLPISIEVVTELQNSGVDPTKLDLPEVFLRQVPAYVRALKGPAGAAVIADLEAHIGSGITGCFDCGVVTGTREAYYEHVLTWVHMANVVNSFSLNVHSIAINCHMKHLLKTDI